MGLKRGHGCPGDPLPEAKTPSAPQRPLPPTPCQAAAGSQPRRRLTPAPGPLLQLPGPRVRTWASLRESWCGTWWAQEQRDQLQGRPSCPISVSGKPRASAGRAACSRAQGSTWSVGRTVSLRAPLGCLPEAGAAVGSEAEPCREGHQVGRGGAQPFFPGSGSSVRCLHCPGTPHPLCASSHTQGTGWV